MPLILPGNVASAIGGGYDVANSCRFNDGDSPSMIKTLGTPTSTKIGTFSCWVKLGNITTEQTMLGAYADSNNRHHLEFQADHNIEFFGKAGGSTNMSLITNAYYRDPSAWYNVVVAWDTSQGTDTNRVKLYVNGTQVTSFATATYPAQDLVLQFNTDGSTIAVGRNQGGNYADGYLAEVVFIDGTQYAATSFGEFDEDSPSIWKPIDVSGLTFGDEGFYCDMEASDNLGNDANGGTDLTEANLAATDQTTDTPTNNFATLNPLDNFYAGATFSEGNLTMATPTTAYAYVRSTLGMASGLWYAECKITTAPADDHANGVAFGPATAATHAVGVNDFGYGYRGDGSYQKNNNTASYGSAISAGDILGIYLDLNANKVYFAINGTLQNSGTGITVVGTTHVPEGELTTGFYHFACSDHATGGTYQFDWNFGAGTSYAVSSGNADANGYGNFEYDPSAGTFNGASKNFYALCTKNLAEFG
jgi:hypothetical protein